MSVKINHMNTGIGNKSHMNAGWVGDGSAPSEIDGSSKTNTKAPTIPLSLNARPTSPAGPVAATRMSAISAS